MRYMDIRDVNEMKTYEYADLYDRIKLQFQKKLHDVYSLLLDDTIDIIASINFNIIDNLRTGDYWHIFQPLFDNTIYPKIKQAINSNILATLQEIQQTYRLSTYENDVINLWIEELSVLTSHRQSSRRPKDFYFMHKYAEYVIKSIKSLEKALLNDINVKKFVQMKKYRHKARIQIARYRNMMLKYKGREYLLSREYKPRKSTRIAELYNDSLKFKSILESLQSLPLSIIDDDKITRDIEYIYHDNQIQNTYDRNEPPITIEDIYEIFPLQDLKELELKVDSLTKLLEFR